MIATLLIGVCNAATATSVLRVCTPQLPVVFDLSRTGDQAAHQLLKKTLYSNLVKWDDLSETVVPDLAVHWTVSTDGLLYRFKLREGVSFHSVPWFQPSRDMTGEDVVYSFTQLMKNPELIAQSSYFQSTLESIESDGLWVGFHLRQPDLDFLDRLTEASAVILSAEYGPASSSRDGKWLPVGTGPFMLASFDDEQQVLVRSPVYWDAVELQLVVLRKDVSDEGRFGRVRTGQCGLDVLVEGPLARAYGSLSDMRIASTRRPVVYFFSLDTRSLLFRDIRVRQAIAASIDKKRLARLVFGREDFAATEIVEGVDNPGALHVDRYNSELSKGMLTSANISDPLIYLIRGRRSGFSRYVGKIFKDSVGQAGFAIEIKDRSSYSPVKAKQEVPSLLPSHVGIVREAGGGTSRQSENLLVPMVRCVEGVPAEYNDSYFCSDALAKMVLDFDMSQDVESRKKALRILANEVNRLKLYIPLAHPGEFVHAWRNNISGIYRDALGVWDFSQVEVE